MGELKIIGVSPTVVAGEVVEGEFELHWDKSSQDDVHKVAEVFQEYVQRGWLATGERDGRKKQIFSFDPDLVKIVLFPVILGG